MAQEPGREQNREQNRGQGRTEQGGSLQRAGGGAFGGGLSPWAASPIPGVDPKDVQIECREDTLIIRGQSEEQKEEDRRFSRRSGSFFAELPIPSGVDIDKARASHKHGILSIHLPKVRGQHQEHVKQIPISTETPRDKAA